jgi:hypothetical protein
MLCVGEGWLAVEGGGGGKLGLGEKGRKAPTGEKKHVEVKFHATEHVNQIEHELNKCIRKPNETTWNNVPYTACK